MQLAGRKLGLLGKGGAGKSTVTVMLARGLRAAGYAVHVLDADSTNFGLHGALGVARPPAPLLEHYGGMVFSGGRVTCPVDDPTPLPEAGIVLEDLPRRFVGVGDDGIVLLSAGKLGKQGAGAGCDGPIGKIARDVTIRTRAGKGVTLVDFKAGFEDSARGVVVSLDLALVVVDPTQASLALAVDMKGMVDKLRAGIPPATSHLGDPRLAALARQRFRDAALRDVLVVLNRVPDDETERFLREHLREHGLDPIACIHEDPAVRRAWLKGEPVLAQARGLVARLESLPEGRPVTPRR